MLVFITTYLLLSTGCTVYSAAAAAASSILGCRVAYAPGAQLSVDEFLDSSCCMCHRYLFEHTPALSSAKCFAGSHEPGGSRAVLAVGDQNVSASHRHRATVDLICRVAFKADEASCRRWRDCCQTAADCCSGTTASQSAAAAAGGNADKFVKLEAAASPPPSSCPATWDGWQCWPTSAADRRALAPCPAFLYPGYDCDEDRRRVSRVCTAEGKWLTDNETLKELSDYGECSSPVHCIEGILLLSWRLTYCCQALSLLALGFALFVYLHFRNLRKQPRIQIHINLCVAMVFYGVISISYTAVVKRPSTEVGNGSVMSLNTVLCRLLNALDKLALLSVYFSMFLEGLYLHWLLVNSFQQPRLRLLIVPAWGFAILATAVYSITKNYVADELCWVNQLEVIEWVCYAPSIAAVVLNLTFLANIQRILWRQLQAHKVEQTSYRRAVKAALMLVPPFGLAMLFLLYHPSPDKSFQTRSIYECFSAVIMNLQGFFVVLVLCFCNAEVRSTVRFSWCLWRRLAPLQPRSDGGSLSRANTIGYSQRSASNDCSTAGAAAAAAEPAESGDKAVISGGSDRDATTDDTQTVFVRGVENANLLFSVVRD